MGISWSERYKPGMLNHMGLRERIDLHTRYFVDTPNEAQIVSGAERVMIAERA